MGSLTLPKLPLLDFTKEDLIPGSSSWLTTCNDVRHALEEYGCFVAVYDKVSSKLHNTILSELEDLFDLPIEVRKQNINEKPFSGYVGQNSNVPLHEALGIDDVTNLEKTQSFTNLMFPNGGNDRFSENIHLFSTIVAELDKMVIRMAFESYGLEKYYDPHVASVSYLLKLMKYRVPLEDETTTGLTPHFDKSFTTIIHQNDSKGLEIETKNGEWITFEPSLTSFLVLAGDAFMAWSNGRVHSPNHRVIIEGDKVRYSFVQFNFSKGIIETPQELVDDEHPLQFKPFDHIGILQFLVTEEARKVKSVIHAYCGV